VHSALDWTEDMFLDTVLLTKDWKANEKPNLALITIASNLESKVAILESYL